MISLTILKAATVILRQARVYGLAQLEEQHDSGAVERGTQSAGAVSRFDYGKEDRRIVNRVDYEETDDEGSDKALESASVISRRRWCVRPCKGDICVK